VRLAARRSAWLLPLLLLGCKVATIRPIESEEENTGAREFDAATYVEALWAEDIPAALEEAVPLGDLLPALRTDPETARARWGQGEGETAPVLVEGEGRVVEVDTSSRTGFADVDVDVPGGTGRVRLQIGPVLRGTSIRDALPTVSFDQFVNQIQYAEVAGALNTRVEESLTSLDRQALEGKRVRFVGATALGELPLTITPLRLEMEEGS